MRGRPFAVMALISVATPTRSRPTNREERLLGLAWSGCRAWVGKLSLCRSDGGEIAAAPTQDVGKANRQRGPEQWAGHIYPVRGEISADEVGSEGARRVHRSA